MEMTPNVEFKKLPRMKDKIQGPNVSSYVRNKYNAGSIVPQTRVSGERLEGRLLGARNHQLGRRLGEGRCRKLEEFTQQFWVVAVEMKS